jgi:hypothetical protein
VIVEETASFVVSALYLVVVYPDFVLSEIKVLVVFADVVVVVPGAEVMMFALSENSVSDVLLTAATDFLVLMLSVVDLLWLSPPSAEMIVVIPLAELVVVVSMVYH